MRFDDQSLPARTDSRRDAWCTDDDAYIRWQAPAKAGKSALMAWFTLNPPPGVFQDLSVGLFQACALDTAGNVACWGAAQEGETTPPLGKFASVAAGCPSGCGWRRQIQMDGRPIWGCD